MDECVLMDVRYNRMDCEMDIAATHCNGCRLNLAALLVADPGNFMHDILGIRAHIDRKTGKLTDHFLPRFAESNNIARIRENLTRKEEPGSE
jgi:hypothetical protein